MESKVPTEGGSKLTPDEVLADYSKYRLAPLLKALSKTEREWLVNAMASIGKGDFSPMEALEEFLFEEPDVPMEEFVMGKQYLTMPWVSKNLLEMLIAFDQAFVREAYFGIGKGAGKSFAASVTMARGIHQLLRMRDPQMFHMLGPGSKIAILNASTGREQAKDVVFNEFKQRIEHSPYFSKWGHKLGTRYGTFPKQIYAMAGTSAAVSALGYNTKIGVMDEASWMMDTNKRSVAKEVAEALLGSLETRFGYSYKFMAISSLRAETDWLYQNIEGTCETGTAFSLGEPLKAVLLRGSKEGEANGKEQAPGSGV